MGPDVGAPLGVTVTTCAGPPLMTSTDAVTVHVLALESVLDRVVVRVMAMHANASLTVVSMPNVTTS